MRIFKSFIYLMITLSCASNEITRDVDEFSSYQKEILPSEKLKCENGDAGSCNIYLRGLFIQDKKEEAKEYSLKLCEKMGIDKCFYLGNYFAYNAEMDKARGTYERACKEKDYIACSIINGLEKRKASKDDVKLFRQKCYEEDSRACSIYYLHVRDNELKFKEFKDYISKTCKQNKDPYFCYLDYAYHYKSNPDLYFNKIQALCERSNLELACMMAARGKKQESRVEILEGQKRMCEQLSSKSCYYYGQEQMKMDNTRLATSYMNRACVLGDANGCNYLGNTYFDKRNYLAAKGYYYSGCLRNDGGSCRMLGHVLYHLGDDYNEYMKYFKKSCNLKHGLSCLIVGNEYSKNDNIDTANTYLEKSCGVGSSNGCIAYGLNLYKSKKVKEANKQFSKSCSLQNVEGCYLKCMSSAELSNYDETVSSYRKACVMSENSYKCSLIDNLDNNEKISLSDIKNKCHYDPDKPWWLWVGFGVLGALTGAAIN